MECLGGGFILNVFTLGTKVLCVAFVYKENSFCMEVSALFHDFIDQN